MEGEWPVYYHLHIKNELPKVLILGRRMRVNVTLVNEMDLFRGDDILAEVPIPLRADVISVADDTAGSNIQRTFEVEIINRHIKVKPVIDKKGQGTMVVNIKVVPLPIPESGIPIILQVGISPKSRIFDYVVPACSAPMLLVAPESEIARQILQREHKERSGIYDDEEEDEEEHDHDHDAEDYYMSETEEGEDKSKITGNVEDDDEAAEEAWRRAEAAARAAEEEEEEEEEEEGKSRVANEEDADDADDEDIEYDDDDDASSAAEFSDDFGDDEFMPEDFDAELDSNEQRQIEIGRAPEDDDDADSDVSCVDEIEESGTYHAFLADTLSHVPFPATIIKRLEEISTEITAAASSSPRTPEDDAEGYKNLASVVDSLVQISLDKAPARPAEAKTHPTPLAGATPQVGAASLPSIMQVQGEATRRPKALPPSLQKKMNEQEELRRRIKAGSAAGAASSASVPAAVFAKLPLFTALERSMKPVAKLADPINGMFWKDREDELMQNVNSTASAYIRESTRPLTSVEGSDILDLGTRVKDTDIYFCRLLKRLVDGNPRLLDHLRVMQLGAGTGMLGIWFWQLLCQRATGIRERLMMQARCAAPGVNASLDAVKCALERTLYDPSEEKRAERKTATLPTNLSGVCADVLAHYALRAPTVVVTSQHASIKLLRDNVFMNAAQPEDFLITHKSSLRKMINGASNATEEEKELIMQYVRQAVQTLKLTPDRGGSGLFAVEYNWGKSFHSTLLRRFGVDVSLAVEQALVASEGSASGQLAASHPLFAELNKQMKYLAKINPNLAAQQRAVLNGAPAPRLFTPSLDVVFTCDPFESDEQIEAFRMSLKRLYTACSYAHAQQYDYVVSRRNYASQKLKTTLNDEYLHPPAHPGSTTTKAVPHKVSKTAIETFRGAVPYTGLPEYVMPRKEFPLVMVLYTHKNSEFEQTLQEKFFDRLESDNIGYITLPITLLLHSWADPAASAAAAMADGDQAAFERYKKAQAENKQESEAEQLNITNPNMVRLKKMKTKRAVYAEHEAVHQRRVESAIREAEIPNRVAELAFAKESQTRVAIFYLMPNSNLPIASLPDPGLYGLPSTADASEILAAATSEGTGVDIHTGKPSPMPYLSPQGRWLYRLFVSYHVLLRQKYEIERAKQQEQPEQDVEEPDEPAESKEEAPDTAETAPSSKTTKVKTKVSSSGSKSGDGVTRTTIVTRVKPKSK